MGTLDSELVTSDSSGLFNRTQDGGVALFHEHTSFWEGLT